MAEAGKNTALDFAELAKLSLEHPARAADELLSIPHPLNETVLEALLDVALQLPADQAARLYRTARSAGGNFTLLPKHIAPLLERAPRKVASLAVRMAKAQQHKPAFALMRAVIKLDSDYADVRWKHSFLRSADLAPRLAPRCDMDAYGDILRRVMPVLAAAAPAQTIKLLCDALEGATVLHFRARPAQRPFDDSRAYRFAIEDHARNAFSDPRSILVHALRDACVLGIRAGGLGADRVVADLRQRPWRIFHRMALHLAAEFFDARDAALLLNETDYIRDAHTHHELMRLTQAAGDAQIAEALSRPGNQTPLPVFVQRTTLSAQELASAVRAWAPGVGFGEPAFEDLAGALYPIVADKHKEICAALDAFKIPEPTIARAVVNGIDHAAQSGAKIAWPAVLDFCARVLDQPIHIPGRGPAARGQDPDWEWARHAVAHIVETGLAAEHNGLSEDLDDAVWPLILALTNDPEPSLADEAATPYLTHAQRARNSVRGEAMHNVFRYAHWCARQSALKGGGDGALIASLPHADAVLTLHLDTDVDMSLSIRAVYGQWLSWLVYADAQWLAQNMERIFPHDPGLEKYRDAAWRAYIEHTVYSDDLFRVFKSEYRAAVDRSLRAPAQAPPDSSTRRLADHLIQAASHALYVIPHEFHKMFAI
jgi:hypothetical protein